MYLYNYALVFCCVMLCSACKRSLAVVEMSIRPCVSPFPVTYVKFHGNRFRGPLRRERYAEEGNEDLSLLTSPKLRYYNVPFNKD